MNSDKLNKMATNVRTGGKGTMRRKKKVPHKNASNDDKKLQATFKRFGLQPLGGIDEANFFLEDSRVIHFKNPKVQASGVNQTFVVNGTGETKNFTELLPGILEHLGPENMNILRTLAEQLGQRDAAPGAATAEAAADEDVPELVSDFESHAQ